MVIDRLRELITPKYQCSALAGGYRLQEPKNLKFPDTKLTACRELLLCQFDGHSTALTPFFNPHVRSALAMVDYTAFVEYKGKCYVFLMELSHTKKKTRQRGSAQRFAHYIEQTAAALYNDVNLPFHYRYLIINTRTAKLPTKPGKFFSENGRGEWKAGLPLNLLHYCF